MFRTLNVLLKRNIMLFINDKKRVYSTFFAPIITVVIFILFGRQLFSNSIKSAETSANITQILHQFTNVSLLVGLLGITSFTSAISFSIFMVQDSEKKIFNDLLVAPIKSSTIRLSYLLVNIILNLIVSLVLFFILLIYMAFDKTFALFSAKKVFFVVLWIVFSVIMNSTFFTFVFSFLKNVATFSIISGALSSVIGFFIGAFVPLSFLPSFLQFIASFIPATQTTSLLKYIIFSDLSQFANYSSQFKFTLANFNISWWASLIYCSIFSSLFIVLCSIISFKNNKN